MLRKHWAVSVFVLLIAAVALTGCCGTGCGSFPQFNWRLPSLRTLRGSGNLVTREMDYSGFSELDLSHAFKVYLSQSDSFHVTITVDDNVWDMVQVSMSGNMLRMGLEGTSISVQGVTLEAEIHMPTLERADLSGASQLIGDMDTGNVRFDVSGASKLQLEGSAGDLTLAASGASNVDLSSFVVADADVEASGASDVTVHATGTLDIEASGASSVHYVGNPTLGRVETSGASSVRPR